MYPFGLFLIQDMKILTIGIFKEEKKIRNGFPKLKLGTITIFLKCF